jgi:hypothetical protein
MTYSEPINCIYSQVSEVLFILQQEFATGCECDGSQSCLNFSSSAEIFIAELMSLAILQFFHDDL